MVKISRGYYSYSVGGGEGEASSDALLGFEGRLLLLMLDWFEGVDMN